MAGKPESGLDNRMEMTFVHWNEVPQGFQYD